MLFELTDEHEALREAARDLLGTRWKTDRARKGLDNPPTVLPEGLWGELAALGWLGIAADEEVGGSGGDLMAAVLLAEEAGRSVFAEPFLGVLSAGLVLDRVGSNEMRNGRLPDLFGGSTRIVCAIEEPNGTWGPEGVAAEALPLSADGLADQSAGWRISGSKILVPDDGTVSSYLVTARVGDCAALFIVDREARGLEINPMVRFDGQAAVELVLTDVEVGPEALVSGATGATRATGLTGVEGGDEVLDPSAPGIAYDLQTLICAADLLGVSAAALDCATDYAKQRVQFGRVIGSFQAVSHKLADVLVDLEIARSLVMAAAIALHERSEESTLLVAAAKAWTSETAVRATETALQVHGGIGFTWELDVHLWLRRARCGAASFGSADYHRDRIANTILGAGSLVTNDEGRR